MMNEKKCNFWKLLGGGRARPAPIAATGHMFPQCLISSLQFVYQKSPQMVCNVSSQRLISLLWIVYLKCPHSASQFCYVPTNEILLNKMRKYIACIVRQLLWAQNACKKLNTHYCFKAKHES